MPDKLKKQGRQMAMGKSEGRIVPLKPGNSGGGKEPDFWRVPGRDQQSGDWLLPINSIED